MKGARQASGVAVVGAGVIGLAAAISLRRAGREVTAFDPLPPGEGGASFGNAGILSTDADAPMALPGVLRDVPGWLRDPLGPLAVRLSYLPRAAPWLARFIQASQLSRVQASSDALRALNRDGIAGYRELLGPERFRDLIRQTGTVQLLKAGPDGRSEAVCQLMRERHGIQTEALAEDDLKQLFPGMAAEHRRGILFPRNGYTLSPRRLTAALAETFVREGGEIRRERVTKLLPDRDRWTLITNIANHGAETVVVAGGIWSKDLLRPLGLNLPLEAERGYHLVVCEPSLELRLPILDKTRGFALTPMEEGLRLAGTVEIGGTVMPPNEERAHILLAHAKALFPALEGSVERIWMGFRPSVPDSVPVVGPVPGRPGLFVAVGHGHYGMIGAPTTGRLVAELVSGRPPVIDPTPYGFARFGIR
jgi:D-amino-acid dehydrogenase